MVAKIQSPLDCLQKLASNVCVWLNGGIDAERPIWIRLWNRAEKRYCTDGGANRVVYRNQELAPPEVVVGDMDSIMSTASRVLLLGGTSGRLDHALAAINSLYNATALLNQKVYCLDGENFTFVLDEAKHSLKIDRHLVTGTCGVVPFCQKPTVVTMNGFRWNLEDTKMAFGSLISTSNFMVKDVLHIKTSAPLIFTMELRAEALY
ncbi:hypothetical protein Q1695_015317 [Nippostrongylus brasiliensis]|nr:hypothetical protein Q1695_015317 [Nippostrongylus brasiliensis]